jgi:hypothetical protein
MSTFFKDFYFVWLIAKKEHFKTKVKEGKSSSGDG